MVQVVAMVTEQQLRPELPAEENLPGGCFAGYEEYCELMNACWHQASPAKCTKHNRLEIIRILLAPSRFPPCGPIARN